MFHPTQWIVMLQETLSTPHPHRRRVLNVSTGQCVQVNLPELRDHRVLRSTSEGLLVLHHELTNIIRLLNPLTRQAADLPPITTNLIDEFKCASSPDNAGLADDRTVLLYFSRIATLALAKPGDEQWVLIKTDGALIPTLSFAGRFYGVTDEAVMVVETSRENSPPRLVVAAELAKPFSRMSDTVHLVDNGGGKDLVLVHRKIREVRGAEGCYRRKYTVYKVDLDAGKMIKAPAGTRSLGGQAVFIGLYRALSVSPRVFPYLSADTVYPGWNCHERTGPEQIGAYRLTDGSVEPAYYDFSLNNTNSGLARPWSIADCLAVYVGS